MNPAFDEVLKADAGTRAGLFAATAQRLGTTPQNVEKDFWVCWTLDALFNGRDSGPRLLFKGGTSLSKGFGLIKRFSEDIDVTVFRDDLGQAYSMTQLAEMSGKKRQAALDEIKASCEDYINGTLLEQLGRSLPRPRAARASPPASSRLSRTLTTASRCSFATRRQRRWTAMSTRSSGSNPVRNPRSTRTR